MRVWGLPAVSTTRCVPPTPPVVLQLIADDVTHSVLWQALFGGEREM